MKTLLVAGAINTDLVAQVERAPEVGETVIGGTFAEFGGGKGANQAVAAARSGASVALVSAVGDDAYGEARLRGLRADGIDTGAIATMSGSASGIAIIIVEASGDNRICDLPGAREHLTPDAVSQAYIAIQPDAVLATNELSPDCLRVLFSQARQAGVPVWFNVAPYTESARGLIPLVDTLMVNRGEAEDILGVRGHEYPIDELAAGLRQQGVKRVVMTLGGDGVRGFDGDADFVVPALQVHAVDTTGAGDTFGGAWAAETLRGAGFSEALNYANRAAAVSVTRPGAQSSIPTRDEVLRD
ncbi:MAG: ribokinase [Thermomicrobiales bacterium]|nr:ribokinase [Thermomicrobiales bacterium]